MKKWYIFASVAFFLASCGGGGKGVVDSNSSISQSSNSSHNSSSYTTENNTTIPKTGIYNSSDSEEIKYLKVINYARSIARTCKNNDGSSSEESKGFFQAVPALTFNQNLYNAALEHSIDLAKSNTFSHLGSGTSSDVTGSNLGHRSTLQERIEANGYVNYTALGENIAAGQTTIEEVVHSWLESPGHCKNIMSPYFKEMGLARYEDSNSSYKVYWTNTFGAR